MSIASFVRKALSGAAASAILAAQPALADDYIYKGDCQRAAAIKQERTVDKLLPYASYRGVQRAQFGKDSCGRENLIVVDLTQQSRNSSAVVYKFNRSDTAIKRTSGTCADPQSGYNVVSGTVTITLVSATNNGVCELYLWSNWQGTGTNSSFMTFANRMVWLNNFSFAITQTVASQGKYNSPLAFTGLPAQ